MFHKPRSWTISNIINSNNDICFCVGCWLPMMFNQIHSTIQRLDKDSAADLGSHQLSEGMIRFVRTWIGY